MLKDLRLEEKITVIVCVTILLSALLLTAAISNIRTGARFVSVRGLSEREVTADLALWPIKATAAANTLPEIFSQISNNQKFIVEFLKAKGFTDDEINITQPQVTDRQAQLYYENNNASSQRYIAEIGVLLKTSKIDKVKKAGQEIGELVGKGVTLSSTSVEYLYTKLNDIKPAMIEEATKEARKAAEKFAKNSGSMLGRIKHANQGLFTIEPVHFYTQEQKNIRVVTDIEYFLR